MADFLERYMGGEHVQVWTELLALGQQVREPAWSTQALAVAQAAARATATAVRQCAELWQQDGYRFSGTPSKDAEQSTAQHLERLGQTVGSVPLIVDALFSELDGVDFRGDHPGWEGAQSLKADSRYLGIVPGDKTYADPLCLPTAERLADECTERADEISLLKADEGVLVMLSGDFLAKQHESAATGAYGILLPESCIDTDVEAHEATTLVDYLRYCLLEWAGFPGWAEYQNPPDAITRITAQLPQF